MSELTDTLSEVAGITLIDTQDPVPVDAPRNPVLTEGEADMAAQALDTLREQITACRADASSALRKERFAGLLADTDWVSQAVIAWRRDATGLEAALLQLEAVQGMTTTAQRIKAALRKRDKHAREAFAQGAYEQAGVVIGMAVDLALESCLGNHAVPEGLVVPPGYMIDKGSVCVLRMTKEGLTTIPICACPVIVTGRMVDVDSQVVLLRVEWCRAGRWHYRVAPRRTLVDSRSIVELSDYDFPVGSSNARDMARYLLSFDEENAKALPAASVSNHMGWQGKHGEDGFVWGYHLLRGGEVKIVPQRADQVAPRDWQAETISLQLEDSVQAHRGGLPCKGDLRGVDPGLAPGQRPAQRDARAIRGPLPTAALPHRRLPQLHHRVGR